MAAGLPHCSSHGLRKAGATRLADAGATEIEIMSFPGVRISARRLADQLPDARFEVISKQVRGPYALLIWRARSDGCDAVAGADSFVIEDGRIRMQTIHYRLLDGGGG